MIYIYIIIINNKLDELLVIIFTQIIIINIF